MMLPPKQQSLITAFLNGNNHSWKATPTLRKPNQEIICISSDSIEEEDRDQEGDNNDIVLSSSQHSEKIDHISILPKDKKKLQLLSGGTVERLQALSCMRAAVWSGEIPSIPPSREMSPFPASEGAEQESQDVNKYLLTLPNIPLPIATNPRITSLRRHITSILERCRSDLDLEAGAKVANHDAWAEVVHLTRTSAWEVVPSSEDEEEPEGSIPGTSAVQDKLSSGDEGEGEGTFEDAIDEASPSLAEEVVMDDWGGSGLRYPGGWSFGGHSADFLGHELDFHGWRDELRSAGQS
ncbi:hypothetical protein BKA70DRAFT_1302105 [Coprinopsis sp. MPI-PUGE-AT-0042]|nr:hypothetical protein BKA70DRAFT_1302105 [Coprinopsis sp. MPI-PUGE-AT-0042]